MRQIIQITLSVILLLLLGGCYPPQPHKTQDICDIFQQYPEWYWAAKATQDRWGVPIPVQMAIMYEESGFQATAEPPAKAHVLHGIPWTRPSTALGYCQALNGTWSCYEKSTGKIASRSEFASSSDFIGWYSHMANQVAHIQPTDAYDLYLSYHEGLGGFHARTFWKKPWLVHIAHSVQARANVYALQLSQCVGSIPKPSGMQ